MQLYVTCSPVNPADEMRQQLTRLHTQLDSPHKFNELRHLGNKSDGLDP